LNAKRSFKSPSPERVSLVHRLLGGVRFKGGKDS